MGHRGSREPHAWLPDPDSPQVMLPSEQPKDGGEKDPVVLQMAMECQLTGCTVSGRLGSGGESVCFAAIVPTHKDVAVKVSLRGYSKADPLVAEHAGVSHLHCLSNALLALPTYNFCSGAGLQYLHCLTVKDLGVGAPESTRHAHEHEMHHYSWRFAADCHIWLPLWKQL